VALMEAPFDAEHASDALQTPLQQVWTEKVSLDARREHFRLALKGASSDLQELFKAVGEWSAWRLFDANPLSSADQMVQGRVALLGDAAHPMLPFLAQGAGMSIEDAERLAKAWSNQDQSPVQRLQTYGQNRWLRNARVQRRARSNATVFHATGMMAGLRDLGLAVLGERLLDMPWLYGYR
jgi:salicylate hydroxylase